MFRNLLIGLLLGFVCWVSTTAQAMELSGPAQIIDGDTLVVSGVTVRLHGIDSAEEGQRCIAEGRKITRPGDSAKQVLGQLAAGGVSCSGQEHDQFGRLIAVCHTAKGQDIDRALVAEGWAWAFVRYSTDYVTEEKQARVQKKGIWAMACEPPWEFRAARWSSAEQRSPKGCPIKGNITANGKIYHTPWSRHYAKTKIDESKGERWFCSEEEAIAAGWRAPRG